MSIYEYKLLTFNPNTFENDINLLRIDNWILERQLSSHALVSSKDGWGGGLQFGADIRDYVLFKRKIVMEKYIFIMKEIKTESYLSAFPKEEGFTKHRNRARTFTREEKLRGRLIKGFEWIGLEKHPE